MKCVHGLVIEDIGNLEKQAPLIKQFEITKYPHYDEIKGKLKQRNGVIDYTLYINQESNDTESSEHLTDLPDELQQLQQQLLEVNFEFKFLFS